MKTMTRAVEVARENTQRSIERLVQLVRTPSPTGEEGSAQALIAKWLQELDADVVMAEPDVEAMFERYPHIAQYPTHWQHDLVLPYEQLPSYEALRASGLEDVLNYRGRPNVTGVLRGTGGGRSLVLNAHIDTVTIEPAEKWTRAPYGAEIAEGLMYGRGTSDMKGGLVAALMALQFLREAGVTLRGDVIFQSVVNEEHSGNGTLDLVRRGLKADAAIVLEPTDNQIFVSHPGGLYWQLTATGVSRSPGARWNNGEQEGVSAIELLPSAIRALLDVEKGFNQPHAHGTHRPFSLVIGKVTGGHYETVTADEALLRGGAYFAPEVGDVGDVMQRFSQAVQAANRNDPLLNRHPARFEFLHHDDSTQQSSDIAVAVSMGEVLADRGRDGQRYLGPFCCDARHLVNQGGIPTIIFGPGTIAQAHKPDEHIRVDDFLASIELLAEFIERWCNQDAAGV